MPFHMPAYFCSNFETGSIKTLSLPATPGDFRNYQIYKRIATISKFVFCYNIGGFLASVVLLPGAAVIFLQIPLIINYLRLLWHTL